MARKKIKDIFADNTQNTDATQAAAPPVEKESRREKKKRQANMTLEETIAESDKQLFGDKLEPNLSRNSVPDVIPEGESKSDRYKTVIEADPYGGRTVTRTKEEGTGTAITNAMSNTAATNYGNLLEKAQAENPDMTFEESQELASKISNVDKEKDSAVEEANNAIQSKLDEDAYNAQMDEEGVISEDGDMGQGGNVPNAQSQTLMGIGGGGDGTQGPPDYEDGLNKGKINKDITEANILSAGRDAYVPQAVVERLGVQDYFPTIGQEIQKGTWTGSVLGSQTIYAGGGMVLPMGLYDARKRALNESAKAKQAQIDKILELPNATPQHQAMYQNYANDFIIDELERYGTTANMVADPKFRKRMDEIKNIGKELVYVDNWIDGKLKDLADKKKWIPEKVRQKMYDFKSGTLDNFDAVMTGEKRPAEMVNFIRSYENGINWIDENAATWFSDAMMDEAPIGVNKAAIAKDPEGYNQFIKSVEDGSADNDSYVTGARKYLDLSKVEPRIDNWIKGNNADAETRQTMVDYMVSLIPEKEVLKVHSMGNDARERAADAMENSRFYAAMEERKKERETPYQYLDRQMRSVDENGYTMQQRIQWIQKNVSDPKARMRQLIAVGAKYNVGTPTLDPYSGAVTFKRAPTRAQQTEVLPTVDNQPVLIKIWDGKKYVETTRTINQLRSIPDGKLKVEGSSRPKYMFSDNGGPITSKDLQSLRRSGANVTQNITELGAVNIFRNKKTGQFETLNEKNFSQYNPEDASHAERYYGNLQVRDKEGNVINTKFRTYQAHEFGTGGGQQTNDTKFGSTGQNLKGRDELDYRSSVVSSGSQ